MAYVTLPSIPLAVHALIKAHNYQIKEKFLRVTFANPLKDKHSDKNTNNLNNINNINNINTNNINNISNITPNPELQQQS